MNALACMEDVTGTAIPQARRAPSARPRASTGKGASPELVDILAARFPICRKLAGADSFNAVARKFVLHEPPAMPAGLHYGERFPPFLRRWAPLPSTEYLADIAELEAAYTKAWHTTETTPPSTRQLWSTTERRFDELTVDFHPSVSLVPSRFPIVTIWEAAHRRDQDRSVPEWRSEAALVAKPFRHVVVERLSADGHAFLNALWAGATLAEAIDTATARNAAFDLGANLALLVESHIVVGTR